MDALERLHAMKLMISLWGLSMVSIVADVVTREYGSLEPYANLGALACVVSLLIFLVCQYLPKLERDRARERAEHISAMDRMADRFERREVARDESLLKISSQVNALHVNCTKHHATDTTALQRLEHATKRTDPRSD